MTAEPPPLSFSRIHAARVAGGQGELARALAALSEAEIRHLARSLEFQGILENAMPELLATLRPHLRRLRPERVGSVERLCWRPLERFLSDDRDARPDAPWIVPRRLLPPLWELIEAASPDLVDQLRRQHLTACFDGDQAMLDQVAHQVVDLAAFVLNNRTDIAVRLKLSPAEAATVRFMARVQKWHRLIMPNARYFQQAMARQSDKVQALRLYSNWYTVFERLDTQFDLYALYLFEMMPDPIDVIDAFPFYFDMLADTSGLAVQWLLHRVDRMAADVAALLAHPPRTQSPEALLDLAGQITRLDRLLARLRNVPLFRLEGSGSAALSAVLRNQIGFRPVERLGEALTDWLHDAMQGQPGDRRRAAQMLGPLAAVFPPLLLMIDSGGRGSNAARLRFRLGDKTVEDIDRYLRGHKLAPDSRRATALTVAPLLDMCRGFGQAEAIGELERRLLR